MNNPRLANRYAKSLLDLAVERNILPAVWADIQFLTQVTKGNPDFVQMLQSPVITSDKKNKVLSAVTEGRVQELTRLFLKLLVEKTRESNLPQILKAFQEQYYVLNNIYKVKFTSAAPVSNELQDAIKGKIKAEKKLENIEWEAVIDESIIGGFKLQLGDLMIDASISNDLKDIKRQFMNNDYMHKLR